MIKFMLFAPPGMGKSTIVARMLELGYKVLDLEALEAWSRKLTAQDEKNDHILFGAAHLNPSNCRSTKDVDFVWITLYEGISDYETRRTYRDMEHPAKGCQDHMSPKQFVVDDWGRSYVVDARGTVDEVIDRIEKVMYKFYDPDRDYSLLHFRSYEEADIESEVYAVDDDDPDA